jgi:hypothetical protein
MRKRLALVTMAALTALGGLSVGASAAIRHAPPNGGAPAGGSCPGADLTCKA